VGPCTFTAGPDTSPLNAQTRSPRLQLYRRKGSRLETIWHLRSASVEERFAGAGAGSERHQSFLRRLKWDISTSCRSRVFLFTRDSDGARLELSTVPTNEDRPATR
jgi:hypothetical protein